MAKTTVPCPRCRTPIVVEITRLFDMNTDPQAKDKLLSGAANFISCQSATMKAFTLLRLSITTQKKSCCSPTIHRS